MTITWEVIAAVLTVITAVGGVWFRVDGMIRANTDALAAYKTHVAETYVTKAGLNEQTAQLIKAIDGVSSKIDVMSGRIDGIMQVKQTTRARGGQA